MILKNEQFSRWAELIMCVLEGVGSSLQGSVAGEYDIVKIMNVYAAVRIIGR